MYTKAATNLEKGGCNQLSLGIGALKNGGKVTLFSPKALKLTIWIV
jgi:hypothetical protein